MHLRLGMLVRSLTVTVVRVVAAVVLAAAGLTAVASPARAAVPDPLFLQDIQSLGCLEQEYYAGFPTVTVRSNQECHYQGHQQWGFQWVRGNSYRVVNHRSNWCLSHPNPQLGSPAYAETCVSADKQLWTPSATQWGGNLLVNLFTGYCLAVVPGSVVATWCGDGSDATTRWRWQPQPYRPNRR